MWQNLYIKYNSYIFASTNHTSDSTNLINISVSIKDFIILKWYKLEITLEEIILLE